MGGVLAPTDKAANNVVVVWRLCCINTLKQELGSTKACGRISTDERSIVNARSVDVAAGLAVGVGGGGGGGTDFLRYIGFRGFMGGLVGRVSLLVLVRLLFCPDCWLRALLLLDGGHWITCCDTVYERDGISCFWSVEGSNDVLNKFKSKHFQASKLSIYDFSTLYTTLPHHLIKDKLIDLIKRLFIRENTQYLGL